MLHKHWFLVVFSLIGSLTARANPTDDMFKAVQEDKIDDLRSAIARGAKVNAKNADGRTATHIAALKGDALLIDVLHAAEADIDVADDDGMTPLLVAAAEGNGMEVCKLLELGAKRDTKDKFGQTAADLAVQWEHYDMLDLLEEPVQKMVNSVVRRQHRSPRVESGSSYRLPILIATGALALIGITVAKVKAK